MYMVSLSQLSNLIGIIKFSCSDHWSWWQYIILNQSICCQVVNCWMCFLFMSCEYSALHFPAGHYKANHLTTKCKAELCIHVFMRLSVLSWAPLQCNLLSHSSLYLASASVHSTHLSGIINSSITFESRYRVCNQNWVLFP